MSSCSALHAPSPPDTIRRRGGHRCHCLSVSSSFYVVRKQEGTCTLLDGLTVAVSTAQAHTHRNANGIWDGIFRGLLFCRSFTGHRRHPCHRCHFDLTASPLLSPSRVLLLQLPRRSTRYDAGRAPTPSPPSSSCHERAMCTRETACSVGGRHTGAAATE